jgi:CBS domain containing-hemolysin-like protein
MTTDSSGSRFDPSTSAEDGRGATATSWLQMLRQRLGLQGSQTLRDTLEVALKQESTTAEAFSAQEREMLLRLLRFGDRRVEDVMVPRADIIAVEETEPVRELLRRFEEAGVSRIPLYHETLDDPRGMVHIKDLFRWLMAEVAKQGEPSADEGGGALSLAAIDLSRAITTTKLRRQVLYVPPSMPAMNLLIRMQTTRIHMAIVVDEYGGSDGLVTIEDLVEQIVGDIEDEHDEDEAQHIVRDQKLGLVASARTPVKELETLLGLELLDSDEEAEIDTLGGLVFQIVGRVPARGELVRHRSGVEFEVLDADPRRVKKLKVHPPRSADAEPPPAELGKA